MDKTIYNTFVKLKSQKQADKLIDLCIEKNLNYYWNNPEIFKFIPEIYNIFIFDDFNCFLVSNSDFGKSEVSEKEFIELLKKQTP